MPTTAKDALTIMAHIDSEDVSWVCDGERIAFWLNCNDLFFWATADCEELTIGNLPLLIQARKDCDEAAPNHDAADGWGISLFAARQRGMRPQNCCYPSLENFPGYEPLWSLFDACGPERPDDTTKRKR